jgi:flagellar protein FliS
MNFALARSRYRQTEAVSAPEVEDPHEVIMITLRELERSMSVMATAYEAGKKVPDDHLSRGLTAIYILQSSLDFEKGEDIAVSLFQLYEYAREQILRCMRREEGSDIVVARDCITDILSAWRQIGSQTVKVQG